MTVRIEDDVAYLEGDCGVAEAETLFSSLASGRLHYADLSGCCELHGAVVQALLRSGVVLRGQASDPFVRDFVAPALERARQRHAGIL
jgi:hypothetical protein